MVAMVAMASKAPGDIHVKVLQDGRVVRCSLMGDVRCFYLMTDGGEYIVQEGDTYRTATNDEWETLQERLRQLNDEATAQEMADDAMQGGMGVGRNMLSRANELTATDVNVAVPRYDKYGHDFLLHMGSPKTAVLLVDFADRPMTYGVEDFERLFDGEGYASAEEMQRKGNSYGSVRQYFQDCSNGAFDPQFDIYGVYHFVSNFAGYISSDTYRSAYIRLVKDACAKADEAVDFSEYDMVCVIASGYTMQNTADYSYITAMTAYGESPRMTLDGKVFYRYFVGAELGTKPQVAEELGYKPLAGIGVICHELCHALGLPDVYPTVNWVTNGCYNEKYDNQSMDYWDLMDSGCYVRDEYCPVPLTVMERWMLGWQAAPEIVQEGDYTLHTWMDNADDTSLSTALRVVNPANNKEFWLLENMPRYDGGSSEKMGWYMGDYDGMVLGSGMTVTHINAFDKRFYCTYGLINNTAGQPEWSLLAADGHTYSSYKCTSNKHAKGNNSLDYYYMPKAQVIGDCLTDTYPVAEGTAYYDKEGVYYEDPAASTLVRLEGEKDGKTYADGYLLTELPAINCIEDWKAHTASEDLLPMRNIAQEGGNGAAVTFTYGNQTAIRGVIDTEQKGLTHSSVRDVTGRCVGTDTRGLKAGVYIVNGKKFLVHSL